MMNISFKRFTKYLNRLENLKITKNQKAQRKKNKNSN